MNKNLGRILSLVLIFALAISAFAGCASDVDTSNSSTETKSEGTKEEAPKSDVTLTMMGTADSIKEVERTKIAEMFKEETGISVDYQLVQDSQYNDVLNTKLNSGTCTDIFMAQGGALNIEGRYNPEKNCVDLSNESWISTYDELVKQNSMANGKVYCQTLWNTNSVWAMVYNKTLFEELGLSVPTTYAEFEAACETIKAAGVTPIYEGAADSWHINVSFIEMMVKVETERPGTYEQLNKNELKVADIPEMYTLVEQHQKMGQEYSGNSSLSNEFGNSMGALADGSYAMTVNRVDAVAQVDKDFPDAKYDSADFGAFVVPYIDNQIRNVNPQGNARFVFSGSENIEEAKMYLEFLARPEILQILIDEEPAFSWLPFEGVDYNFIPAEEDFYGTYVDAMTVPQSACKYFDPQWGDICTDLQASYLGQITAEELLQNIDERREVQAKEIGDEYWD